jgi:hypothetical protein
MNFDQLLNHANGTLHDSTLESVAIDYVARTVRLGFNVSVGDPDAADKADRGRRQRGSFLISGLAFLVIEPPDPRYPYQGPGGLLITDDGEVTGGVPKNAPDLPGNLSPGAFVHYFFVNPWNCFIYLVATGAEFQWS